MKSILLTIYVFAMFCFALLFGGLNMLFSAEDFANQNGASGVIYLTYDRDIKCAKGFGMKVIDINKKEILVCVSLIGNTTKGKK